VSGIHFNVEAAESFCSQLQARREALSERLGDERAIYDSVFNDWKDRRGEAVKERLDGFTRQVQDAAGEIDDLLVAVRRQIGTAREILDASEVW
jgi:hypothetical protein